MENVIEIKHLTKSYGKLKALDDFSLEVKKGEILGLLGPNGCGKSTTINTVLSLLKYDSGDIKIFNQEMKPTNYDVKSKIGVVFQEVAVFEELSVFDNIDYFCGLYVKDKNERKKCVQAALDLTELNEFKKFVPKKLSGGLLRRLNIACGIAHKPSLIFLDEPTVAVDPQSRNKILEGIKVLNDNGATIVYTSHYMEEVEQLCHQIVIMDKGKIIASGTKDELKEKIELKEIITVMLEERVNEVYDHLSKDEHIISIDIEGNNIHIKYNNKDSHLEDIIDYLKTNKIKYSSIYTERPTLNDVFLELTGKELRD
ncbi:MAG: ABC transporter ATP-binding protein [Thomasclavelia sp.]|nr:ABC transporter ATP-binding protein [Thomasclavelia sp.]